MQTGWWDWRNIGGTMHLLFQIIVDALEKAKEKDDVDIQPLLLHSNTILYLGQDDNASMPCWTFSSTCCCWKAIFQRNNWTESESCRRGSRLACWENGSFCYEPYEHYWKSSQIALKWWDQWTLSYFVLVHNETTDPSTGLKHIVNSYEVLIKLSRKSRSAQDNQFVHPFPYPVNFEADGGTDHRATILKLDCISWSFIDWKHGYSCGN